MLGISKRIAKLGEKLSAEFIERARFYFSQESTNTELKARYNLMGAMLAECGTIIAKVTGSEATDNPDDGT